jgi:hypothetical protein
MTTRSDMTEVARHRAYMVFNLYDQGESTRAFVRKDVREMSRTLDDASADRIRYMCTAMHDMLRATSPELAVYGTHIEYVFLAVVAGHFTGAPLSAATLFQASEAVAREITREARHREAIRVQQLAESKAALRRKMARD